MFKSNAKMFLKATYRPLSMAELEPDPNDKTELPNENKWVFELYDQLRTCITDIIVPMDEYLEQYRQYE